VNWLAHFVLSPSDDRVRLGNWLADILGPAELATITDARIRHGLELHRRIDRMTDRHPAVLEARSSLVAGVRRFSPIVLDVAWDHFLSRDFRRLTGRDLDVFVDEIHSGLVGLSDEMPPEARNVADRMIAENWLRSYATLDGYELTLRRISNRLTARARARFDPSAARRNVEAAYSELGTAFDLLWKSLKEDLELSAMKRDR
jgi:acyl carrier protein phosphodiesterase